MPIKKAMYVALTELGTKNEMRKFRNHSTAWTYIRAICKKEKSMLK